MEEQFMQYKLAFAALQPHCVLVMSAPSLQALSSLAAALDGLNLTAPMPTQLALYVLTPLRMIIRRQVKSELRLLEVCLVCVSLVLSRVASLELWDVFCELFMFCCLLLDHKLAKEAGYGTSEDLSLAAVKALRSVLLSISKEFRRQFFCELASVGHCVAVILANLEAWSSKTLRKEALSALLALSGVDSKALLCKLLRETETREEAAAAIESLVRCEGGEGGGGVMASFLPGITISLTKLITSDANIGSSIVVLGLVTWAHYVSMVMSDKDNREASQLTVPEEEKKEERSRKKNQKPQLNVDRTAKWLSETDNKLALLVGRLSGLVTSEGWRVRVGMVGWAHCLLRRSHRTVLSCMPAVLEVLVTLSHDDYQLVAERAQLALELFSEQYHREGSRQLLELVEERLHDLSSALPRLMRQHDDDRKVSTLQLLAGYLRLLGNHVTSFTHSHAHLTRITQALVQTLELETEDICIQEQPVATETQEAWSFPLRYRHFRSEKVSTLLQQVCQLLGFHGDLRVVLDHLTERFRQGAAHRKELLVVISHVLLGAAGIGCVQGKPLNYLPLDELCLLVEELLTELLAPDVWDHSTISANQRRDFWPAESQQDSSEGPLLSCLLLSCVGVCARVLGGVFERLLQCTVFPLMQKLGDDSPAVRSHAMATLTSVYTQCGYSSLSELVTTNADYLINAVAVRLRSAAPGSAYPVLQAMLTHGGAPALPLMRDSLDELLLSLDVGVADHTHIWPVLLTLSRSTRRWTTQDRAEPAASPAREEEEEEGKAESRGEASRNSVVSEERTPHVSSEEIRQFFLDYHSRKQKVEEEEEEEEEGVGVGVGEEEGEGGEGGEQQNKLSPSLQAAVDVLQRCSHFLATTSSLLVLEALEHCLVTLSCDQDVLLPEVHNVWAAFTHSLGDRSPPVALRAWQVLVVMSDVCRDFLRKRVVKGVWPTLVNTLQSLAPHSKGSDAMYKRSAQCKLQQRLLGSVGELCEKLAVPSQQFEPLAVAALPYLSDSQPAWLQETCVTSLTTLIQLDADLMWLLLQSLQPEATTTPPPGPAFKPYKIPCVTDCGQYCKNVQPLIELSLRPQ